MSTVFRGADLPSERAQQVVQRMLGHASAAMTHAGVSPPAGERRTDRRAAKAVWILELPGRSGTIHLMHHCPGLACSCHDLSTFGAVHKSFIAKLSANWPTSNCFAVQHDSEYRAVYR